METRKITVRVRDLGLAAALVSCDFEIKHTCWDKSGRAYFVFDQTDSISQAINDHWAERLNVKSRKYFDGIKMLKSFIYSER